MTQFRIASFNVENLFARPKVFNFKDKSVGAALLTRIGAFGDILKKDFYTDADKRTLLAEYNEGNPANDEPPLKDFILIREDQGKLWSKRGWAITGVRASGSAHWSGTVEFKKARFKEIGRQNTARVLTSVRADVACIVEAESRPGLRSFDTDLLSSMYPYEMLLDGNDQRGIDVGLYSKFPLGEIRTHMFDRRGNSRTFSRDCPEYEVKLPGGRSLFVLCNHLKSKGYGSQSTSDDRRKKQAEAIAEILQGYDLSEDWVVVAGDMNDTPDSSPLEPLMEVPHLFDVLALGFPTEPAKRWTYHYKNFEQIDYVLVSEPLKSKFATAGVERRGMYNLKQLTASNPQVDTETQFDSVTHWTNAASDHGAVWADFDL